MSEEGDETFDEQFWRKLSPDQFQLTIKTIMGKKFTVTVSSSETIGDIMEKIHDHQGVPTDQQRLISADAILERHRTLKSYNITSNSDLTVSYNLGQGPRQEYKITILVLDKMGKQLIDFQENIHTHIGKIKEKILKNIKADGDIHPYTKNEAARGSGEDKFFFTSEYYSPISMLHKHSSNVYGSLSGASRSQDGFRTYRNMRFPNDSESLWEAGYWGVDESTNPVKISGDVYVYLTGEAELLQSEIVKEAEGSGGAVEHLSKNGGKKKWKMTKRNRKKHKKTFRKTKKK